MAKEYDVKTITKEDIREMIRNGDDSHNNQIRCTKDGKLFLSQDIVGIENIENVQFSFEVFIAGNDYVGVRASEDDKWIDRLYKAIINRNSYETYIDIF